jgi:endo-beta-N-acetylglucosaminidase D
MKGLTILFLCLTFLVSGLELTCFAEGRTIKTIKMGDDVFFDKSEMPPAMVEGYLVMKVKCAKCHKLSRTVIAVNTGIGESTHTIFNRASTKKYGLKMMRKRDSDMNKKEVDVVIEALNYMLRVTGNDL